MFNFIDRCNLFFSTSLKSIIRKECQSFTNHGHAKTPPTVFNPLSLWLTLPRDMGVSHTLWPPSIARAILACLWFAQGLHKAQKKSKQQSRSMMFRVILCVQFYRLTQLIFFMLHNLGHKHLRPQKISPRRILHVTKITPGRNLFAVGLPLL